MAVSRMWFLTSQCLRSRGAADTNKGQPPVTRVVIEAHKGHKGSVMPTMPGDGSLLLKKVFLTPHYQKWPLPDPDPLVLYT